MARILAVDDSASVRQMVSLTLKGVGHEVLEASNGIDALTATKYYAFDLVVTDVNMPKMDGISLVKALRELPDYKFIPIVMLTTQSGQHIKSEGKSAGVTGWLVKPFNPHKLLSTIEKAL